MSNWNNQLELKKETKERDKVRKETLGKYFYDLSKLVFVAVVLGGIIPLFNDKYFAINWIIVFIGGCATLLFALIGNKILK